MNIKKIQQFTNNIFTNDFVLSNLNNTMLENPALVKQIVQLTNPTKFKIDVLNEVFNSFFNTIEAYQLQNFLSFERKSDINPYPITFPYDKKNWVGTVMLLDTVYNNKPYLCLNIKLPNDGFVYTEEYESNNEDLIENEQTINFTNNIIQKLNIPDTYTCEINYKLNIERLEFYFDNNLKNDCKLITVKFEYGTYQNYEIKKKYTVNELKNLKKNLQKKLNKPREVESFDV